MIFQVKKRGEDHKTRIFQGIRRFSGLRELPEAAFVSKHYILWSVTVKIPIFCARAQKFFHFFQFFICICLYTLYIGLVTQDIVFYPVTGHNI